MVELSPTCAENLCLSLSLAKNGHRQLCKSSEDHVVLFVVLKP